MKMPATGTLMALDEASSAASIYKHTRTYLGASVLGKECERQIYYEFFHPQKVTDPRINRIFEFGRLAEKYMLDLLKEAGFTVFDGEVPELYFNDGDIQGHADAVVVGIPESDQPHLVECKSMNDQNFQKLKKEGMEKANQTYWVQIQIYMLKFELENGLFMVINKNDSEIYLERVKLDKAYANHMYDRARRIIADKNLIPDRKYKEQTFYKCRMCNFNSMCWK